MLLGAAKCGTSGLYDYLNSHPDVYMSDPKEPVFFEAEYEKGMDYYWKTYFSGWNGEKAVGEARHRNLYLPYVGERIAQCMPENTKFLAILRDPIERAYSHWWHLYSREMDPLPFDEAIEADLERIGRGIKFEGENGARMWTENLDFKTLENGYRTYVDSGYYSQQLRRFMQWFPKENFRVVFLEELSQNPQKVVSNLWEFLEVDPNYSKIDFTPRNASMPRSAMAVKVFLRNIGVINLIPRGLRFQTVRMLNKISRRGKISPETRKKLKNHFSSHNQDLAKLLNRRLPFS